MALGCALPSSARCSGGPQLGGGWPGRSLGIFAVWIADCLYSFLVVPGELFNDTTLQVILKSALAPFGLGASIPALFCAIFYGLGLWPAIYCSTLLPGAPGQALTAGPFVWSSFLFGAYGLSPYLALRELRGAGRAEPLSSLDFVTRELLESKVTGVFLFASGVFLAFFSAANGVLGSFAPEEAFAALPPLIGASKFARLSVLDFFVLWALFPPVLLEDGQRRGRFVRWTPGE
ncbi:unnamed protein product, partial [Polarella glacialis]